MDTKDFNGVFMFTNWTDEDFTGFWNNKEYIFTAKTSSPIIIDDESLKNIQEIRKRFAYKLAQREFYGGKEYDKLVKMGNKSAGGMPPIFDEKILEPLIEKCLNPLPVVKAVIREGKKRDSDKNYKVSKAISDKDNPNFVFKDDVPEEKGKMPDKEI